MWISLVLIIVVLIILLTLAEPCNHGHYGHCNQCKTQTAKIVLAASPTVMDDRAVSAQFLLAGKMSCKYMDLYKWRPVHTDNRPYVMLDAVNTFHRGDVLMAKRPSTVDTNGMHTDEIWKPMARVVSVMNINAFPVVVLDRPVFLAGYQVGVAPTPESAAEWTTTLLPDPIKSPVHEMTSMSRYQA